MTDAPATTPAARPPVTKAEDKTPVLRTAQQSVRRELSMTNYLDLRSVLAIRRLAIQLLDADRGRLELGRARLRVGRVDRELVRRHSVKSGFVDTRSPHGSDGT